MKGMITFKGNFTSSDEERVLKFMDKLKIRGGYEFLSDSEEWDE